MNHFKVNNPLAFSAFTMLGSHHDLVPEHSIAPIGNPVPIERFCLIPHPHPQPPATINLCVCLCGFACLGHFMWLESCAVWPFVSVFFWSTVFSGLVHVVACVGPSRLFTAELYFIVWIEHVLFIHLSMDGHMGYLCLWATVNHAAVTMHGQVFI